MTRQSISIITLLLQADSADEMAIVMLRCTSLTQVQHTKTSTECHQPATVALCLQHLTVVPLTTHESRSNTWKIGNAPVF